MQVARTRGHLLCATQKHYVRIVLDFVTVNAHTLGSFRTRGQDQFVQLLLPESTTQPATAQVRFCLSLFLLPGKRLESPWFLATMASP